MPRNIQKSGRATSVTPAWFVTWADGFLLQAAAGSAFTPGKNENMKKNNKHRHLARAYYDLLATAHEQSGTDSVVVIMLHEDGDEEGDLLKIIMLPRAIHTISWAIADGLDDYACEALIYAMQAHYHPDLTIKHIYPLLLEIDDAMLRTAEDEDVTLIIDGNGSLSAYVNGYYLCYTKPRWRVLLPDNEVAKDTLAAAIEHARGLPDGEKR